MQQNRQLLPTYWGKWRAEQTKKRIEVKNSATVRGKLSTGYLRIGESGGLRKLRRELLEGLQSSFVNLKRKLRVKIGDDFPCLNCRNCQMCFPGARAVETRL